MEHLRYRPAIEPRPAAAEMNKGVRDVKAHADDIFGGFVDFRSFGDRQSQPSNVHRRLFRDQKGWPKPVGLGFNDRVVIARPFRIQQRLRRMQ